MKRPLLILFGSLLLAYGVAIERSSTYDHDIRTIPTFIYQTTMQPDHLMPDTKLPTITPLIIKDGVGEHGQLTEHSKHKISVYFWQWFSGTLLLSLIVLAIVSKENGHE